MPTHVLKKQRTFSANDYVPGSELTNRPSHTYILHAIIATTAASQTKSSSGDVFEFRFHIEVTAKPKNIKQYLTVTRKKHKSKMSVHVSSYPPTKTLKIYIKKYTN